VVELTHRPQIKAMELAELGLNIVRDVLQEALQHHFV
jgi:hypothetical protein